MADNITYFVALPFGSIVFGRSGDLTNWAVLIHELQLTKHSPTVLEQRRSRAGHAVRLSSPRKRPTLSQRSLRTTMSRR